MINKYDHISVTFVIVTHNSENFILKCINSILCQIHKNLKILIIDNNSNDSTLNILDSIKNNPQIQIILNPNNIGYGNAINKNLKNISSDFTAILNADVYLEKNWSINLIKSIISDEHVMVASGLILFPDDSIQSAGGCMDKYGAIIHRTSLIKSKNLDEKFPFFFVDGSAFLIRTDFFKKNPFDPNLFLYYEDVDLCWRIRMLKYDLLFVPEAVSHHDTGHKNKEMTLKKFFHIVKNRLYICQKNFSQKNLFLYIPTIILLLFLNSVYYDFKFKTISYTFEFIKALFSNIRQIKSITSQRKNGFHTNLLTNSEFNLLLVTKSIELSFFKNKILFKSK